MKPNTLVTGANGYTGYWFSRYLVNRGDVVRAMYYVPDGKPQFDGASLQLIPGDIRDRRQVAEALEGIETVFHIAALYRPTNVGRKDFWDVNVEGTRNMVELAAKAGVKRFVHCSTMGVHGTVGRTPLTEEAPIQPDDDYQESKWEGERLALTLANRLGLPLTVIRPAGIYGPYETRFLKLTQLIARGRFVMFGSGETYYHFVHVRDLSEAFVLAAESDRAVGRAYLVGDDYAISLNHMVGCLAEALGVRRPRLRLPYGLLKAAAVACEGVCRPLGIAPPIHRRRAAWFASNRTFDISRARAELGYRPAIRIEDGLREMVQSYREAGWLQLSSRTPAGSHERIATWRVEHVRHLRV
ncbi:MAG: NAD-dependent epimerase/dehydratase family protein [Candidatus Omnitrophica bacterium]|nr:NAD-dependent epimerase/dehydratase family protein [Candidatus Omnitrophota bacterium]